MFLNCKSFFSFQYGTFSTEELVQTAAALGVTTLALTNINGTFDTWAFVKHCREQGIKPVAGAEIRNDGKLLYILLAANNKGFAWINRFISDHLQNKKPFPVCAGEVSFFTDEWDGFVIYPFGAKEPGDLFANERIGIKASELTKLFRQDMNLWRDKLVVRQPVTFQDKTRYNVHRLLRAIDLNTLLSKLPVTDTAGTDEYFVSPAELIAQFAQYPFIISNTYRLLDDCHIDMDFAKDKNKQVYGGSPEDDRQLLEKLARGGLVQRYGNKNTTALQRLEKELKIINDLGFNAYFLINLDIIRYAQSKGYYYVGRGSGANSIVAYCLYITDVDPIELNLFFERFLNPHRTSPPDFDIDFSYTDRDDVMDYVLKRHGKQHTALLGAYTTYQYDSCVRELGKVFGLPPDEIKELQRERKPQDQVHKLILQYSRLIQNFPSNTTVHACGMLITEKPITEYTSLFLPPKGMPTTHIDMFVAEDVSINKFDVLSQRGLGHIRESLALIKQNKGIHVNIHDFENFRQDPAVRAKIREADTIGCFYIESPAMRQLLKKLRCDDYITLVAASSIIRPGVAQSGMMREYIHRYHHRDEVKYLHPLFEEHLSETFGVMVFQEDVIKIAHFFAGLDLGEADILRRAMSGKYRSHNNFRIVKEKYFANCKAIGHTDELAAEVWRQMESFAGYSFNKAHSASFAVESYMSLYLKTYFPKEFMVAVINNFGGYYSREVYFMELLKTGIDIQPPCINNSDLYTNIRGEVVHTGFIHIKGLHDELTDAILADRKAHGPFLHLQDFIERIHPGLKQLNTLVSIGAFRFTGKSKKRLLWEANFLQKHNQPALHNQSPLFDEPPLSFELPELCDLPLDDLYDEMEIMGFTLRNPFAMADDDPARYVAAKDMHLHKGKTITMLLYFIARKHAVTKNDDSMFFGTFYDSVLDWVDTVHFPDAAERYPLHTSGFYRVRGKVTEDFGVYSLEVGGMWKVGYKTNVKM
ncbi:MAG: DNA polymerase III subunit alpha [Chitinophagaceae bacterium]|nr:DNA polymerase III subunit alpha [Chitinophagaceae bacterium]